jgi:hypothetical protein
LFATCDNESCHIEERSGPRRAIQRVKDSDQAALLDNEQAA